MPMVGDWATWVQDALLAIAGVVAGLALGKQSAQVDLEKKNNAEQLKLLRDQLDHDREASDAQFTLLRDQLTEQRAFNKKQMDVLDLQAKELDAARVERHREYARRRKAQASMVFLEVNHRDIFVVDVNLHDTRVGHVEFVAELINGSAQPIYDVEVKWHAGTAEWITDKTSIDRLHRLMPGNKISSTRRTEPHQNLASFGAVVEFRDAAGLRWRQTIEGQLKDLDPDVA